MLTTVQSLKRFIQDLYGYGSITTFEYVAVSKDVISGEYKTHADAACALSTTTYPNYHFARTPKVRFKNEHGMVMTGDGNAYKKMAIQRAINADEFHLEDPSGNSDHIGGVFRRDNWHEWMWLNSQLVLRFDNDYFNNLGSTEVS